MVYDDLLRGGPDAPKGDEAPDPLSSDVGRTDDVPDVNADADTGGATTPDKAAENVE